jgi:hypothetical protein
MVCVSIGTDREDTWKVSAVTEAVPRAGSAASRCRECSNVAASEFKDLLPQSKIGIFVCVNITVKYLVVS